MAELVVNEFSEETVPLFRRDAYTPDALNFENDIAQAVKPVILEWLAKNHSIRELTGLAIRAIVQTECELILISQSEKKTLQDYARTELDDSETGG